MLLKKPTLKTKRTAIQQFYLIKIGMIRVKQEVEIAGCNCRGHLQGNEFIFAHESIAMLS
jgi:hypothetical protein